MKAAAIIAFLLITMQPGSTSQIVPGFLLGRWIIGKPFYDMSPQPIGIDAKQEHRLIGANLRFERNSVSACGANIQVLSVEANKYSADEFLQAYHIRPDQIGLVAPVIEYSFVSHGLSAICGSPEAFEIMSDGKDAVLDVANDYLHLTKVKISN